MEYIAHTKRHILAHMSSIRLPYTIKPIKQTHKKTNTRNQDRKPMTYISHFKVSVAELTHPCAAQRGGATIRLLPNHRCGVKVRRRRKKSASDQGRHL